MALSPANRKVIDWVLKKLGNAAAGKAVALALALCVERDEALERVAADVRAIKGESLKTGFAYLADASHAADPRLQRDLVNDARRAFTRAVELEQDAAAARAAYQVGVCYELLGEAGNARRWYVKSFEMADGRWTACHDRLYALVDTGDQSDVRAIGLTLLALTLVGAPVAIGVEVRIKREKAKLEDTMRELDRFIPKVRQHLAAIGAGGAALKACAARHYEHKPQDEYRSFARSDGRYGMGH